MSDKDIYDLFTEALEVTNKALEANRDSAFYGTLISGMDKYLDGHKAGVAIYDDDPKQPFDYFTLRYLNGKFEILSRGKSEHDTEWRVAREYLASLADEPDAYIENPAKLDIDWLRHLLPDSVNSLLKKAS
ncbi:hypothetical protein [Lentisalinibacter sediminis]|uniref:hypothetical protein n=1 Tax=Lentisalinibacter sediminis TaxID=2992237 RepID=UPI00386964D7